LSGWIAGGVARGCLAACRVTPVKGNQWLVSHAVLWLFVVGFFVLWFVGLEVASPLLP